MPESNIVEIRPDYQFLLLVNIVCADGQLHSEELKYLEKLAQKYEIEQLTRDEMNKTIACDDNRLCIKDLADRIDTADREETMRQMIILAHSDGFFAASERETINNIGKIWNWSPNKIDEIIKQVEIKQIETTVSNSNQYHSPDLSFSANLLNNAKKFTFSRSLVEKAANFAPETIGNTIERLEKEILLSGPEYQEAIEKCSTIAEEDYEYVELALNKARSTLSDLANNLQQAIEKIDRRSSKKGKNNTAKEVAKQLESSRKDLDVQIVKDIEQVEDSLNAKKRAIKYFTVSFMGKTKAGKSTLHAVITQDGWEAIGVGKQRTTRLNRVYQWKNIRIVDTPGIGAPGGKSDREIAESIIEESDVICYVVTSDSIQETEFQFLKLLKEKTKPLIILLNIKKNLRDSRRLEHFLKQPDKLFAKEGKSGIQGHLDRIRRYAKEYYPNDYFDVVPVMLLAAQLSSEPEHKKHKNKLYKASRIQDFLDSIRESIIKHGSIRRSQTFLGSTVGNIQNFDNWITEQLTTYQSLSNTLKNKRHKVNREIEQAKEDILDYLEQEIEDIFRDASKNIQPFAEYYWDENESLLNYAWKRKLNDIKFESRLESAFQESARKFETEAQEILEEVGKELQLISQLKAGRFSFEQQDTTSFRNFMRIGGGVLTLAGFAIGFVIPPLGIFMGIVGGLMSFFGGLFESRNEKRRKAVKQISKSLSKQLKEQKEKVLKQANTDFRKHCSDFANNIHNYFDELVEGLDAIATQLETAKGKLQDTINYLNCGYAKRIIDWSLEKYEPLNVKNVKEIIAKVEREFGHHMKIYTKSELDFKISEEQIKQILQEDISIQTTPYESFKAAE